MKNRIRLRYHKGINDQEMVELYDFTKLDIYNGITYRILCGSKFYYFDIALYEIVEIEIY